METESTLNRTAAQALDALKRHFGVSDQAIADGSDGAFSRSQIEARRSGRKDINLDDIEALAETFDVPPPVFLMSKDEVVRYVLDHNPVPPRMHVTSGFVQLSLHTLAA